MKEHADLLVESNTKKDVFDDQGKRVEEIDVRAMMNKLRDQAAKVAKNRAGEKVLINTPDKE